MSALAADPKSQLRQDALSRRRVLDPAIRASLTDRLVERGVAYAREVGARIVSAFSPIRYEPDALALLAALSAEGFATALPITVGAGKPLVFRLWRQGDPTVRGALGIAEPAPAAPAVDPDLLFVPLAAFDRRGHRIGYGAGHYDRTLHRLRAAGPIHAVGVAYSACEVAAVPDEGHDERLDFILTEREWIDPAELPLMRLLFIGDVVGRAGRTALLTHVGALRRRWALDFVVVNGENAAGGFGLTEALCEEFLAAGVDAVTLGNHAFDQREALVFIERQPRLIRPANFPKGTPGRGANLIEAANGARVLVVNMMGRIFMDALDDPFARITEEVEACPLGLGCDAAIVDFHAEATSEKQTFGHFLDGRVSLVVGTHTHTPTADARVLPGGTAYMSDAGMTGDYDSVIGMDKDEPLRRFTRRIPSGRFEPALGVATLCGVAVETGADGLARRVAPVRIGGALAPAEPDFWNS